MEVLLIRNELTWTSMHVLASVFSHVGNKQTEARTCKDDCKSDKLIALVHT